MADPVKKKFTFISRAAPYGSNRPQLCLDAALAASVFEQEVNYVFLEDGVYQLLESQSAEGINAKTLGNAMQTLNLYGIEKVLVDAGAMTARGLRTDELVIPVTSSSTAAIAELIRSSDYVFSF